MSGQICSSKGPEKGYPVSIVQVEELGSSSLYVKWEIIDSKGIGGYEVNQNFAISLFIQIHQITIQLSYSRYMSMIVSPIVIIMEVIRLP